jgi:hypothetical protein
VRKPRWLLSRSTGCPHAHRPAWPTCTRACGDQWAGPALRVAPASLWLRAARHHMRASAEARSLHSHVPPLSTASPASPSARDLARARTLRRHTALGPSAGQCTGVAACPWHASCDRAVPLARCLRLRSTSACLRLRGTLAAPGKPADSRSQRRTLHMAAHRVDAVTPCMEARCRER